MSTVQFSLIPLFLFLFDVSTKKKEKKSTIAIKTKENHKKDKEFFKSPLNMIIIRHFTE